MTKLPKTLATRLSLARVGFFVLICAAPALTAAPAFQWAASGGGTSSDYATGAAVDPTGSTYVIGYCAGSGTFGSHNVDGGWFLAKYATNGDVLWATRAASTSSYMQVAAGSAGDCYIGGTFTESITIGNTNFTNGGPGDYDFFLARYDSNGNMQWARRGAQTDITNEMRGLALTTDSAGNCHLAGDYFDADFGTTNFSSGHTASFFIAKFDTNGSLLQVHTVPTTNNPGESGGQPAMIRRICLTPSGGYCIAGFFFKPFELGSVALTNASVSDLFVACLDASGNLLWVKNNGSTNREAITGLAVDALGNTYLGSLSGQSLSSPAPASSFLTKYDADGNLLWRKQVADFSIFPLGFVSNTKMGGDALGNTYITSYFEDLATFGAITVTNSTGAFTVIHYLQKVDPDGNVVWVKIFGGADASSPSMWMYNEDYGGIAVDAAGNCSVAGYIYKTNAPFDEFTLHAPDGFDAFVARVPADPPRLGISSAGNRPVLSWYTNQPGFTLESNTSLEDSNGWSEVGASVFDADIRHYVTNPPAGSSLFFRLRKP